MSKPNVLFLCTGNSCRSIMAEALLRHRFGDRLSAHSAGTSPKGIHPFTIQVLEEIGVDTTDLRSKDASEYLGRLPVQHLIVVCGNAEESCPRIWPGLVTRQFWPLDDPLPLVGSAEERMEKFRAVRDEIECRIAAWVGKLAKVETEAPDG